MLRENRKVHTYMNKNSYKEKSDSNNIVTALDLYSNITVWQNLCVIHNTKGNISIKVSLQISYPFFHNKNPLVS
jgi:ribosomal protein S11